MSFSSMARCGYRLVAATALAIAAAFVLTPAASAAEEAVTSTDRARAAEFRPIGHSLLVVSMDLELVGRRLSYSDLLSGNLRSYEVIGVPTPSIRGEVFPFLPAHVPVLRDLGMVMSYARAVGLRSEAPDGSSVPTSHSRLHAGLRGRIRPASDEGPIVGMGAALRLTDFTFETEGALSREVASVSYVALRFGVDGRLPLGRIALEASGAYQAPLSTGELASRFRQHSAGGVDFDATVAVPFAPGLEARTGASYTRFFYSFEPEPGDTYIAGGALDQFFNIHFGVAYSY